MPVACDLYLPEDWAHDRKRRLQAGVPPHLTFRTKIEMAIDQIRHAVACRAGSCWPMPLTAAPGASATR